MTTTSPLFTGEVRTLERKQAGDVNFPVRKTATGKVLVPFKGALRGALEQILRAKNLTPPVCDTGASKSRPCGRCDVCHLFGSMGVKSRATVDFLVSDEDKSKIVREATHIRIDREKGSTSDTFKGEEVIEGAVFTGKILIANPTGKDTEYIKSALKHIEEHGLCGWTSKGYGKVKFETNVKTITRDSYLK